MLMKAAIIGAGLSGLACAHELKRHGIIPTIFEKKGYVGEVLDLPAISLDIFNTVVRNPLEFLRKEYKLSLYSHYELNEIILNSPCKTHTIKGKLGSITLRGREPGYITIQLQEAVNLPVTFYTLAKIDEIKNDFDHIFIGTGSMDIPIQMNLATVHFEAWTRIASILGEFRTNSVTVWMNTEFARHGYAYMVPVNNKAACLVLIVDGIEYSELDYYWDKFLSIANMTYDIIEIKDIKHTAGHVYPIQVDNLYLMGNTGGFLDGILGFGTQAAMISGVVAANCAVNGLDYNKAMEKFTKDILAKYEFRKVFNTFDNDAMDLFCSIETFPVIKQLIFNNPMLKATYGSIFAKLYSSIIKGTPK